MTSIFISYVRQDIQRVNIIATALRNSGFHVWLDQDQILPGQDWDLIIRKEINRCDYFLSCWSSHAVAKPGFFHAEYRYAQELARQRPEGDVFLIPIRLNDCIPPFDLGQKTHIFDCFSNEQVKSLISAIRKLTNVNQSAKETRTPEQVLTFYKKLLYQHSPASVTLQISNALKNGEDYPAILYLLAVVLNLSPIELTSQKAHTRLLQQLEPMLEVALKFPYTQSTAKVVAASIAFDFYYNRSLRSPYDYRKFLQEALAEKHSIDWEIINYLNYSNSFAKLIKPIMS